VSNVQDVALIEFSYPGPAIFFGQYSSRRSRQPQISLIPI
jgi:hypothetical protein